MPGPRVMTSLIDMKRALKRNGGIYSLTARDLGCSRDTVRLRVNSSPELQAFVREIDDDIGDIAVAHIVNAIKAGDMKTVRWYASVKLRHRGYSQKVDLNLAAGEAPADNGVIINVIYRDVTPALPGPEVEVEEVL